MADVLEGELAVEVYETDDNRVCLMQKTSEGDEQTVILQLKQAEELSNWLRQYAQATRDSLAIE